jgi:hypothetical protein
MAEEMDAKEYRRMRRQKRRDNEAKARIRSQPPSDEYAEGWERVFGNKKGRI